LCSYAKVTRCATGIPGAGRAHISFTFLIALLAFIVSCGDEDGADRGGTGPPDAEVRAEALTRDGWQAFEAGDVGAALSRFDSALALDDRHAEAFNGLGWSWLRFNSLSSAIGHFDEAIGLGLASADPYAGQAVAYRDLEPADLEMAAAAAESALVIDLRFTFAHDSAFDWKDLRLILAQSRFGLHQYLAAAAQVESLGGEPLDRDSRTFVEDLLLAIQALGTGGVPIARKPDVDGSEQF
jgi:tetratricopeptide (TPR) repeat protein